MQFGHFRYRRQHDCQEGYILLTVMLFAALAIIALAAELPAISSQIRHDREEELIHRGAQYARAIKRYYKKFGSYPVSIEQLQSANHMRFLRKKYKDPITGEDFRLLHIGDVQLTLRQPAGSTTSSSSTGQTTSLFGSSQSPASQAGSGTQAGAGTSGAQQSSDQASSSSSASQRGFSSSGFSGPKMGGGPIIGVASDSKKKSFHVFNEKDHYADWAFIYDPTFDRGQGLITGPYNGTPTYGGGQIPGAVSPGQMNSGQNPSASPNSSPFGQQQNSPFGQQQNSPFNQQR